MIQDNIPSAAVDRELTQMEDHANQLDGLREGLGRALLQYENILNRIRGQNSELSDKKEAAVPTNDALMPRIRLSMDRLSTLSAQLNNASDELNGIM